MKKRIAALMLSICMMISILPTSAFAVPDVEEAYPITQEETAPEVQAAEQEAPALQEAALDVPEEDPAIEVQTAEIADEPAAEVQAEPEQQPALEAAEPVSEAEPEVQPEVQEQPVEETEAAAQPEASTEEQPAEDETEQSEVETEPASEETGSEEAAEEPSEEETETSVPDDTALFALGGDTAMYVATDTVAGEATVYVGKTITLTGTTNGCKGWVNWSGSSGEYYDDTWTTSNSGVATVSNGVVTGVSSGTATITHTYCKGDQYQYNYYTQTGNYSHQLVNETFTVTVKEIVAPTAIKISGEKEVKVYETIQLSALLEPEDAYADITWESSDTGILTVDATGAVYGVSEGTATVTAYAGSLTANISITVKAAEQETASARFFFLKDPSKDYTANESANWSELTNGSSGTINVKNIVWQGGANNYETSRVLTWPDGSTGSTYTVAKGTAAWNTIFDAFSASYGVTDKDDVESIILTPYKISSHAYNGDGNHVDCTVTIVAKSVCTVLYKFMDVGDSLWSNVQTDKLHPGDTTAPEKTYPATKTVNGVKYTFMGWYTNPQLSGDPVDFTGGYTVNGNTEFYAKYVAGYNVIYNANGGVWRGNVTNPCLEGHTFTISANTPTREGYTFEGWESSYDGETYQWGSKQSFVMPGCNVVLKAKWKVNTYTVTWKNYDGEELKKDTEVEYGTMPSYDGETPVKPEDTQFTYEFSGWTPKLSKVTKDITYTAQFTPVEKTFTVTWVNYDGTELEKDENVAYNSTPSYDSETPVKPENEQFTYTFAGWNPKLSKVTNNITYTAQYEANLRSYQVTYDLNEGSWLSTENKFTYENGSTVAVSTFVPTREGYNFLGWKSSEDGEDADLLHGDDVFTMPTHDVTLTAQWAIKTYTIKWVDGNGNVLKEETVEHGTTPSYDGDTPKKDADEQFTYTFDKWDKDPEPATRDMTYTAEFTPSAIPTPTPSTEPTPSTTPTPSTEPSPSTAPTPSTEPTPSATPTPSTEPTPSTAPTPSTQPSAEPSTQPSVEPSTQPSAEPSTQPSVQPTPSTTPVVPAVQPVPSIQPNPTPVPAVITTPTPTPSPAATPAVTPENTPDQTVTPVPEDGEIIPDEEVPTAPGVDEPAQPEELEAIADDATPLAGGRGGHWALINLILAILTVLASLLLLIGYIGKKKKALEDEDGNEVKDEDGNTVWEYEKKKKGFWRVFSLIPAIVSVIAFILTENMRLPMRLVDRWTLLMVIIAIVQIVVAVLCKKRKNKDDEDRDDQQNQDAATVTA